jgi:hypothetical protein
MGMFALTTISRDDWYPTINSPQRTRHFIGDDLHCLDANTQHHEPNGHASLL